MQSRTLTTYACFANPTGSFLCTNGWKSYFGNMPVSASTQPKLGCGMMLALHPLIFRPLPQTPPSGSVTRSSPKLSRVSSSWERPSGLQPMLTTICPNSLTAMALFCKLFLARGILNRPGCFSSSVRCPVRSMPSACCPPRPQQGLLPPMALLHADLHDELLALAVARAQLALRHGGLGLRSAAPHATAAYWASWADSLRAIAARAGFADRLLFLFASHGPLPPALDEGQDYKPALDLLRGWQRLASRALHDFLDRAHRRELSPGSAALLDSHCGPFAARVLTVRPTSPELTLPASFCAACACRCPSPLRSAAADNGSMCTEITRLPVRALASSRLAAWSLSVRQQGSAEKPAPPSPSTLSCVTSMWMQPGQMTGALKSYLTACLCGGSVSS